MKLLKGSNLSISYLPRAFYHYIYNPSSITQTPSPRTIHAARAILEWITAEGILHDENQLYPRKIILLHDLFLARNFSELPTTCPEIHARYIREHQRFNIFAPIAPSLALALRGWPRLAYRLCCLCLRLVSVKESVQRALGLRK